MAPCMLIDLECYRPPEEFRVNKAEIDEVWNKTKMYSEDDILFFKRVFDKSGLSPTGTYLPPAINPVHCGPNPKTGLDFAFKEAHMAMCGAVEGLLAKTGLRPTDIDILVTTCSIYCPTPSMASMLVNAFKMKPGVQSYHLGGMGCSNGVVGINLVVDLLKAHPGANALFVTTETTTPAYYSGKDRHRQVTNLIFRMGAAAMLLSNNPSWGSRAKYTLQHHHRVHVGQSDEAFSAIHFGPDSEGINGIYLGKNVVTEASKALTRVMWKIGPKVLSVQQKVAFARNWATRAIWGPSAAPPFTPCFSGSVEHFLIHAGGAKVLDGIGKALQLVEHDLEPSRAVLHDYGNVSSSTTWYTLGFVESYRGVKRGDRVLQIGVGSGIKCGVNVWKATRDIKDVHPVWEHRVPEAEAAAARAKRAAAAARPVVHVDSAQFAVRHVLSRLLFLVLMLALMAVVHAYMAYGTDGLQALVPLVMQLAALTGFGDAAGGQVPVAEQAAAAAGGAAGSIQPLLGGGTGAGGLGAGAGGAAAAALHGEL